MHSVVTRVAYVFSVQAKWLIKKQRGRHVFRNGFVEDAEEDIDFVCVFVEDAEEDAETIVFLWKTQIGRKNIR